MASEMLLLFVFQCARGVVYQMIGLIVGFFMAGLAAGALVVLRAGAIERPVRALALAECAWAIYLVVCAALAPWALGSATAATVFVPVAVAAGGFVTGLSLTLAGRALAERSSASGAASRLWAFDNAGAFLGAALGGTVLVASLGVAGGFLALAAVKLAALAMLVLARRAEP
jgi:predicted MFS family arabinose efflux permease